MKMLSSIIQDPVQVIKLEPEELAGVILEYLNSLDHNFLNQNLEKHVFCGDIGIKGYPKENHDEIRKALMEAWIWLEKEGFLAPRPGQRFGHSFITRRGKRLANRQDLNSFRLSNLLPVKKLHPLIAEKSWPPYIRGEYDTAVFQSFREVEIQVRQKGNFKTTDIGVGLMRAAYNIENGPLTYSDIPNSEKQAMSDLFAGSIGLYKNPGSHREVIINDPFEAVELIILASRLLKIVDKS